MIYIEDIWNIPCTRRLKLTELHVTSAIDGDIHICMLKELDSSNILLTRRKKYTMFWSHLLASNAIVQPLRRSSLYVFLTPTPP